MKNKASALFIIIALLMASCGSTNDTTSSSSLEHVLPSSMPTEFDNSPSSVSSSLEVTESPNSVGGESYVPQEGDDAYYQTVVSNKENILKPISELVQEYKNGTTLDNLNHYPLYPDDFPDVQQLPTIVQGHDFTIRFAGNPDALGSVYVAIPIGDDGQYEMHICVSESYDEKSDTTMWGTSDVFFNRVSALQWHKQDVDLYVE